MPHLIVVLIPTVQTHIITMAYFPLSEMFARFVLYSQRASFHNTLYLVNKSQPFN